MARGALETTVFERSRDATGEKLPDANSQYITAKIINNAGTAPANVAFTNFSNGADGTSILVNVDVAADQAATIAQLAAQDRIALVRDAGR